MSHDRQQEKTLPRVIIGGLFITIVLIAGWLAVIQFSLPGELAFWVGTVFAMVVNDTAEKVAAGVEKVLGGANE